MSETIKKILALICFITSSAAIAADCPADASCAMDIKTQSKLQDEADKKDPRFPGVVLPQ